MFHTAMFLFDVEKLQRKCSFVAFIFYSFLIFIKEVAS